MATGVAANPDGIKRLNVELGDGDDIIHTGKLDDNTEIVIDGGRGRDVFDVSRSKTNATVNKIVTIKNIEAGDKIKLADYFAHGYDPKDPDSDGKDANWGVETNYGSDKVKFYAGNHPGASTSASDHGQTFKAVNNSTAPADNTTPPLTITGTTSGNSTSTVNGYKTPTGTASFEEKLNDTLAAGGNVGGDRYVYQANHGDFSWQTGNSTTSAAGKNISSDPWGTTTNSTNYGFNNSTSPFYEPGKAAVRASVTPDAEGQAIATGWTQGPTPTTPPSGGGTWNTFTATQVNGGTTVNFYSHPSLGLSQTSGWYLKNGKLFDPAQNTRVNNELYDNTYNDINNTAGGGTQEGTPVVGTNNTVVIQNSGVAGTKSANAGTITANNLKKSIIVDTATNSDKYTGGIGANDQSFYDAHNAIKVTVNSKLTDLTSVAGMDTLIQAVNHAISSNRLWGNDTTYWTSTPTYFNKYADANSTSTTSDNVIMGYVRHIRADGNYDAHNDRLYAFSWRGDTYLVYDKKAVAYNGNNAIGQEDTIVRLAGVNLDSLKYTVDPKTGTITIDDVQFGG